MIKKSIFLVLFLFSTSWTYAETTATSNQVIKTPVQVGFIGPFSQAEFEAKIKPFFKDIAHCEKCEIVNLTPYNEKQEFDAEKLWTAVLNAPAENFIIYLHWNEPVSEKNKSLIEQLNQKLNQDLVLVGYAGQPVAAGPGFSLNKTVLGQVHQAVIIGELTERERLLPQLFYGPEMVTAVKPPRDYLTQGLAPLMFVSQLAKQYNHHRSQDWPDYLRRKKAKNKKLWPDIVDLF